MPPHDLESINFIFNVEQHQSLVTERDKQFCRTWQKIKSSCLSLKVVKVFTHANIKVYKIKSMSINPPSSGGG